MLKIEMLASYDWKRKTQPPSLGIVPTNYENWSFFVLDFEIGADSERSYCRIVLDIPMDQ